jgi:hypothetical protein
LYTKEIKSDPTHLSQVIELFFELRNTSLAVSGYGQDVIFDRKWKNKDLIISVRSSVNQWMNDVNLYQHNVEDENVSGVNHDFGFILRF